MRHDCASPTVDPMDEHEKVIVDAVLTEFDWDPSLDASRIRVVAADGAVFLHGKAGSFAERWAAARAALRAAGVLYVHNEIEIDLQPRDRRSDEELRGAALRALQREPHSPNRLVEVDVSEGHVTLRGLVDQPMQIDASEAAVRRLAGVVDLRNELRLRSSALGRNQSASSPMARRPAERTIDGQP
jgi:osmotically-inducible protein OsmY